MGRARRSGRRPADFAQQRMRPSAPLIRGIIPTECIILHNKYDGDCFVTDLIKEHKMELSPFAIIVIAFVVIVGIYTLYLRIKTRKQGIETEAVVTDVVEQWERSGDSDTLCYYYTVEYKNYEGETVTARLGRISNTKTDLNVGDCIMIRYLKDKQGYPVMSRKQ